MTTYLGLRSDIRELTTTQKTESRIYDLKIKALEDELAIIQDELDNLQYQHQDMPGAKSANRPPITTANQLTTRRFSKIGVIPH